MIFDQIMRDEHIAFDEKFRVNFVWMKSTSVLDNLVKWLWRWVDKCTLFLIEIENASIKGI